MPKTPKNNTADSQAGTKRAGKNASTTKRTGSGPIKDNKSSRKSPAKKNLASAKKNTTGAKKNSATASKKDSAGVKKSTASAKKNSATASKASAARAKQAEAALKKTSAAAKKATSAVKKAAPASKKTNANQKKAEPKMAANQGRKRKAAEDEETSAHKKRKADTKTRTPSEERKIAPIKQKKAEKPKKVVPPLPEINQAPTARLDVFMFGTGENSELGLGTKSNATRATRPRLNPFLSGEVGVVSVVLGGMHGVALTHDNKIYTWGVNDNGALGRPTSDEDMKFLDAEEATKLNEEEQAAPLETKDNDNDDNDDDDNSDDDDDEGNGLNKDECTPLPIPSDYFPEGAKFAQIAAGDSVTVALTTDGRVFGWGTFRDNQGELGFDGINKAKRQFKPTLVPGLKNIVQIDCGTNHVVALDKDGTAWTFGTGPECQLGRRTIERRPKAGLTPATVGTPKKQITKIWCAAEHSFATDKKGNVWAWGLNSMGQCGIAFPTYEDKSTVAPAAKVDILKGHNIVNMAGGSYHTVAVAENGEVITFGATNWHQAGVPLDDLPKEDFRLDDKGKPAMTLVPHVVPGLVCDMVAAAGEVTIAVAKDGKAYSWGQSSQGNLGQGPEENVIGAHQIDNTAVRGRKLVWAGCGGVFSALAALQEA